MSRVSRSNERYEFAFGVDHTPMGPFVQVWDKLLERDDSDTPHVECDALFGLRTDLGAVGVNPKLAAWCSQVEAGIREAVVKGINQPHLGAITVCALATALGFGGTLDHLIYQTWD